MASVIGDFFVLYYSFFKIRNFDKMKKTILFIALGAFLLTGVSACKAKHCAAMQDDMEGFKKKKGKKKRGRQEGLFDKSRR